MKRNLITISSIFMILSIAGCKGSLVEDIYRHAQKGSNEEMTTAFVALSNISLSESEIEVIRNDYRDEKNKKKKYLYEFLLSKRTQEEKYILSFIERSGENIPELIKNKTRWVSVSSPIYKQLSYYARTNDEALVLLFKLTQVADGGGLSEIAEDLLDIYTTTPDRFLLASKKTNIQLKNILNLMEGE